jgi:AraC-like DNA-binding protein
MDPLSQVVELLRPHALHRCKHMQGRGNWAIRFPTESNVVFGLVAAGSCCIDLEGLQPQSLHAGDFLLLSAPPAWVMRNGAPVVPIDFEPSDDALPEPMIFGDAQGRDTTRIIGGYFAFDPANSGLLAELLPQVMIVRSGKSTAGRLQNILGLIEDEVSLDRPGQQLMLGRLLDVMLLEALRAQTAGVEPTRSGLLSGLADPKIAAALHALHANVRRVWSVEALASCAGMSRSAFAERFSRRVGATPNEYLLNWRMALAKDALRFSNRSLAEIALVSGYGSTSAFSTAFSRTVGIAPGAYRGKTKAAGPDRFVA